MGRTMSESHSKLVKDAAAHVGGQVRLASLMSEIRPYPISQSTISKMARGEVSVVSVVDAWCIEHATDRAKTVLDFYPFLADSYQPLCAKSQNTGRPVKLLRKQDRSSLCLGGPA